MAEPIEIVVLADCVGDGEAFLRGETRIVSKETYQQLRTAGRVCLSDEASEAAQADLAARQPAPPAEPPPKSKGKGD